jgi:hypothetical protein
VVAELTPHHRLHGVANLVEIEELKGDWEAVLALEEATVTAVDDNRDTPCVRNARSLLVCTVAREVAGDTDRRAELEALAAELEPDEQGISIVTPRTRLALIRGEVDALEELLSDVGWLTRQTWFELPGAAARLDALAVIGTTAELEQAFAPPSSYLEPFALRALGVTKADEDLLSRADARFRELGLDWHAAQTEQLRRLRKLALG